MRDWAVHWLSLLALLEHPFRLTGTGQLCRRAVGSRRTRIGHVVARPQEAVVAGRTAGWGHYTSHVPVLVGVTVSTLGAVQTRRLCCLMVVLPCNQNNEISKSVSNQIWKIMYFGNPLKKLSFVSAAFFSQQSPIVIWARISLIVRFQHSRGIQY